MPNNLRQKYERPGSVSSNNDVNSIPTNKILNHKNSQEHAVASLPTISLGGSPSSNPRKSLNDKYNYQWIYRIV